MGKIIEVKNLVKRYGELVAVNNISFNVDEGELFSFVGVNGAGKSTTISMLVSLLKPDGGTIRINGLDNVKDATKIKKEIGVVFQTSSLDEQLTVKENLKIRASFYGIYGEEFKTRFEEIASIMKITEYQERRYGQLSGGQKRRVDIARALLHQPRILFLDEPTTGLDPQTRITLWKELETLRKEKKLTIFLTTHYMEETDSSSRVVIIDKGQIVVEGTPYELKKQYAKNILRVYCKSNKQIIDQIKFDYKVFADYIEVYIDDYNDALKIINSHKQIIDDFELIKGDMDHVFVNVTGKELVK